MLYIYTSTFKTYFTDDNLEGTVVRNPAVVEEAEMTDNGAVADPD